MRFARRSIRAEPSRRVLLASLIALAALLVVAWWGQDRITFQPPRIVEPVPAAAARVEYQAEDGQRLFALVVGADSAVSSGTALILLAFHGNADLAAWLAPWAVEVARRTHAVVVIPEFRGYGGLSGRPTAAGVRLDARAAVTWARSRFGATSRFAYYGHSLGSSVATDLAAEMPPAILVLESPFTSARDMAARFGTPLLGWLWPLVGHISYDSEKRVRELDIPVWVAHGEDDRVVPVRMGRAVFAAARRPRELLIVAGGGHNGLAESGGAAYWTWLEHALH